jgi:hypothetical protein
MRNKFLKITWIFFLVGSISRIEASELIFIESDGDVIDNIEEYKTLNGRESEDVLKLYSYKTYNPLESRQRLKSRMVFAQFNTDKGSYFITFTFLDVDGKAFSFSSQLMSENIPLLREVLFRFDSIPYYSPDMMINKGIKISEDIDFLRRLIPEDVQQNILQTTCRSPIEEIDFAFCVNIFIEMLYNFNPRLWIFDENYRTFHSNIHIDTSIFLSFSLRINVFLDCFLNKYLRYNFEFDILKKIFLKAYEFKRIEDFF